MRNFESHTMAILDLIDRVRCPKGHTLIGIAGPPGSGKSTLGAAVVERLNAHQEPSVAAQLVPMDGFHLENSVLDARKLLAVKGAPETFDVAAFVALVHRLREGGADIHYPIFNRAEDRSIPRAGCVRAGTPIVVVEGNYLLLRTGGWAALKSLFDATVMIAPLMQTLERRLIARWLEHGLSRDDAMHRVRRNDLMNARKVMEESAVADLLLRESDNPELDTSAHIERNRFT